MSFREVLTRAAQWGAQNWQLVLITGLWPAACLVSFLFADLVWTIACLWGFPALIAMSFVGFAIGEHLGSSAYTVLPLGLFAGFGIVVLTWNGDWIQVFQLSFGLSVGLAALILKVLERLDVAVLVAAVAAITWFIGRAIILQAA